MTTWTPVPAPVDDNTWSGVSTELYTSARTYAYDTFVQGAPGDSIASRVDQFGTQWKALKPFSNSSIPFMSGASSVICNGGGSPPAKAIAQATSDFVVDDGIPPAYTVTATFRWLSSSTLGYGLRVGASVIGNSTRYGALFTDSDEDGPLLELQLFGSTETSAIPTRPQTNTDYPLTLAWSTVGSDVSLRATFLGSTLTLYEEDEATDSRGSTSFELFDSETQPSAKTQGLHLRSFIVRSLVTRPVWNTVGPA